MSALYAHLWLLSMYDYFHAVKAIESILAKMTVSVKRTFQYFIGHARILLYVEYRLLPQIAGRLSLEKCCQGHMSQSDLRVMMSPRI